MRLFKEIIERRADLPLYILLMESIRQYISEYNIYIQIYLSNAT